MIPLIVLLLLLVVFGGLGFLIHVLWFVLIALAILWLVGFFAHGAGGGRWYRW